MGSHQSLALATCHKDGLTIHDILLVSSIRSLVGLPHQLLNLVLEFPLQRPNLLQHYPELDERLYNRCPLCWCREGARVELKGEDGEEVVEVGEEEVVLEGQERDTGRVR
jgi:hypothetical protein